MKFYITSCSMRADAVTDGVQEIQPLVYKFRHCQVRQCQVLHHQALHFCSFWSVTVTSCNVGSCIFSAPLAFEGASEEDHLGQEDVLGHKCGYTSVDMTRQYLLSGISTKLRVGYIHYTHDVVININKISYRPKRRRSSHPEHREHVDDMRAKRKLCRQFGTSRDSWARPRGAQHTAGYTVNTYSIIHSALARLAWRAYARHTFSGLAALCRMPKTKLIGRPVPEIWPNLARTDRLTRDRHDLPTNQPTSQPFCQYPAVSWEFVPNLHSRICFFFGMLSRKKEMFSKSLVSMSVSYPLLGRRIECVIGTPPRGPQKPSRNVLP